MPIESLLTFCTIIIAFLMLYVSLRQMHGELGKEISALRREFKQEIKNVRDDVKATDQKVEALLLTLFNNYLGVGKEATRPNNGNRKSA